MWVGKRRGRVIQSIWAMPLGGVLGLVKLLSEIRKQEVAGSEGKTHVCLGHIKTEMPLIHPHGKVK